MIPVSLTLAGIYSYREKQTIDFQPLTGAGIFGIFGSVGSGKSTILEAISYALYGETERLHKRDDRAYNMMNLKSKELFIDFIFKAGKEEQEYRFMVKGKRNSKNFEKITSLDRTAYKKINDTWEPVEVTTIASILQLSYENFRRTIIIPQGKFQEFLELGQAERNEMMKELFHLQRFDLSEKAATLEAENNEQRIRLEERLQQTGSITAEEISAKENESQLLLQQLQSHQQELAQKRITEQSLQQLKKIAERIVEQKSIQLSLQQQEGEMLLLEQRIKNYEFCLLQFKPLFERSAALQAEMNSQDATLKAQHDQLQQTIHALQEKENLFPAVKAAFENRQELKSRCDELIKIKQLHQLQSDLRATAERSSKGTIFLLSADRELAALQLQKDALSAQLKELKTQLPDLQELSDISNWFVQKNAMVSAIQALEKEQQSVMATRKKVASQRQALFTPAINKLIREMPDDLSASGMISELRTVVETIEENITEHAAALQHLLLQQKLEEHAAQLKPGEPCPLCGATDHPHILSATAVKAAVKKALAEKDATQKKLEALQALIHELDIISSREAGYAEQLSSLQERLLLATTMLQEHDKNFTWAGWSREAAKKVKLQFDAASKSQTEIAAIELQLETIEKSKIEKEALREKGRLTFEALNATSASLQAQVDLLLSQFVLIRPAEYEDVEEAFLDEEIRQLNDGYLTAEKNYHAFDQQLQQLRNTAGQLKGSITAGHAAQDRTTLLLQETNGNIGMLASDSGISQKEAAALLASSLHIADAKQTILLYQQKLHTTQQLLHELETEAAGRTYDQALHTQLLSEITALTDGTEQTHRQLAGLEAMIRHAKQQLVQRILIMQQLSAVQLRGEDIATIRQLFKANGFVTYVSGVHLQQLCNAANERFYKLTRQKMRLELSEGNNFLVRDYMNNGQTRSVKTLSGGQKFQAALSLALALADSIQQHAQSNQNFFFLDEGFGSLDADSLDLVFETLRALRKENRIVGIISHVKEMQQEIDTCLSIVNDEEAGSRITANW